MNVNVEKLIENLEEIRDKLKDNNLLEIDNDLTISVAISILKDLIKDGEE